MMSKTHVSIGIATSIALISPKNGLEWCATLIGSSIGSIICDIDSRSRPKMRDALWGRIIATIISIVAIIADLIGKFRNNSKVLFIKLLFKTV